MLIRLSDEIKNVTTTVAPQSAAKLSSAELHQLLVEFNDSAAIYQRDVCLHQLFEAQVTRTPDAPCLIFRDEVLTYRELNARANQLAHRLRKVGVKPETMVGLYMERSLEMVIAMNGILKAGGAYVPLDPSYPQERLDFMLADTNVPVLLTQQHLKSQLPMLNAHIICLDTEWERIAQESKANPDRDVREEHLAYVIYTSGSTGKPKGVMTEHRGICNQLQWMQASYPLTSKDAVLLRTPFSFDYSLYEFFSPLLAGARVVLAEPEREKDSSYLVDLIQREQITRLFVVPSLLHMLLTDESFAACQSLKNIFSSGEALPLALQQRFFARMPLHTELHNFYGPTEASIECAHWDCERDTKRSFVPVGRPMGNYQIYILDDQLQPVPIGTPGELHIGGTGLARGYWNRPELTAEKFISIVDCGLWIADSLAANPKSKIQNPKLYKTGDLARWHPDGVIECLGRIDFQVKIRGHRIELGEIETNLASHSAVRECVVTAREDVSGDKRLVAYFVPQLTALPTHDELREFLKQKLPEHMIPAAFVPMESFPLSPNGKIDRKRLPAPEAESRNDNNEIVAPSDEIESKLVHIWEEVLRIHPIGVTDNFFDLGGHSLLAVRIFAAIENEFQQKLPLAMLFQAPTIKQLAALLRQQGWQPSWSTLVPLQPNGKKPPFFCVHAVGGNVLEYYALARHLNHDQPFYGLQAVGLDGRQAPLTSIEELAAHYLQAIRQAQPNGPYYLGGRSFGGVVAYEMAQQLQAEGEQVALVALFDTDPIGWLNLFPRHQARKQQARFLALRIQRHLSNLRGLNWRGKFDYLQDKAAYKKRRLDTWRWQLKRIFRSDNQTHLTDALREVEEVNYQAQRKYCPSSYPGRVTFFSAREEVSALENQFGWQTLAQGGVEIIKVPGDHQTMIKEPHVQQLARQLTECLHRAMTAPKNEM